MAAEENLDEATRARLLRIAQGARRTSAPGTAATAEAPGERRAGQPSGATTGAGATRGRAHHHLPVGDRAVLTEPTSASGTHAQEERWVPARPAAPRVSHGTPTAEPSPDVPWPADRGQSLGDTWLPRDRWPVGPADGAAPVAPAGRELRERAIGSAVRAYTAAHGHPLEHESDDSARPGTERRRWALSPRVTIAGLVALTAITLVVVLRGGLVTAAPIVEVVGVGDAGVGTSAAADGGAGAAADGGVPAGADEGGTTGGTTGGTGADPGAPAAEDVVVHVVGQVAAPGVVTLAAGARVTDAIAAAGGPTAEADLSALNLARELVDGEQVAVPRPGEVLAGASPAEKGDAAGAPPTPSDVLDLNTADATALDALPGIGPVLAQRIVDWRSEHGRFTSVDELGEVSGIGPSVLEGLRELVGV